MPGEVHVTPTRDHRLAIRASYGKEGDSNQNNIQITCFHMLN